jgi:phenylacetate-coenzyme A ligase PaaK-like adenylate-forming protein
MTDTVARGFWNRAAETMPRERLREMQWAKLRTQLRHVYQGSEFHRARMDDADCRPDDLAGLDDYFARFPLLHRADLLAAEAAAPPYGTLAAVDPALAIARHQTSGSSGLPPVRTFDTARDWAWISDMFACGLYAVGIRPGDQVAVVFGYGMFIGFWAGHYGLQRMGATAVATGSLDTERRIRLLMSEDIKALMCTPTYALHMAHRAERMGVDLATQTNVELLVVTGEPRPARTRRLIEKAWGAPALEVAGMTEVGTLIMFECGQDASGMHIIETDVIEEVLDAETKQPVAYGERGVRVMTTLGRESLTMLRYWTNDIVVRQPYDSCSCGRTWDLYQGGILGRADDVKKIRGCLFTPSMVEDVARSFDEIEEFQTVLDTIDALDTLIITLEPKPHITAEVAADVAARFGAAVKQAVGVTPHMRIGAIGSLPRFEMKAKRFTDARPAQHEDVNADVP